MDKDKEVMEQERNKGEDIKYEIKDRYLGKFEINGEMKTVLFSIDGPIKTGIWKCHTKNDGLIGANNKSDLTDRIILTGRYADDKDLEKDLQDKVKEKVQIQKLQVEQNLNRQKEEQQQTIPQGGEEIKENGDTVLSEEQSRYIMANSKATINPNQDVAGKPLYEILGQEDEQYEKYVVLNTSIIRDMGYDPLSNTRFSMLYLNQDGRIVIPDSKNNPLEPALDQGLSPKTQVNESNRTGEEIEEKMVDSIYRIKRRGGEVEGQNEELLLAFDIGQAGEVNVDFMRMPLGEKERTIGENYKSTKAIKVKREGLDIKEPTREEQLKHNGSKGDNDISDNLERIKNYKEISKDKKQVGEDPDLDAEDAVDDAKGNMSDIHLRTLAESLTEKMLEKDTGLIERLKMDEKDENVKKMIEDKLYQRMSRYGEPDNPIEFMETMKKEVEEEGLEQEEENHNKHV